MTGTIEGHLLYVPILGGALGLTLLESIVALELVFWRRQLFY